MIMQDKSATHYVHKKTAGDEYGKLFAGSATGRLFPIVAIGASFEGVEAVYRLLDNLSPALGMAYVVIMHLPSGDTGIRDSLQQHTTMKVQEAYNNMLLETDHVYLLSADSYLGIGNLRFVHLPLFRPDKGQHIIDHFFTMLAGIYRNNAFAIVLSGAGADGAAGVRAIRGEGGITFAQDDSAAFRGMPQTAVESGFIDFVLSPEGIAAQLEALKNYSFRSGAILGHLEDNKVQLSRIYLLLSGVYEVDFSLYKQSTVNRRIIRRMTLNRIPNLEMYVKHLEANREEVDQLYKDLLSGVGGFFREPALGRLLARKIFPALMKDRPSNDPIRIWLPACSGGEEACTLAIYLLEYLKAKDLHFPIQLFATDLNQATITLARTGFYTRAAVQHVSSLRLKKFFTKVEGGYQVIKAIKDICIFATHNFLKDPPFSKMDLISCQDVLLSLEPAAQQKALQTFHYAVKPAGYLMLGRNDVLDQPEPYFVRAYKEWKIYVRRPVLNTQPYTMAIPGSLPVKRDMAADQLLLSHYVPAGILVDMEGQIIRFYGNTNPYLRPQAGKASLQLFKILHEDLIYELRSLFDLVKKEGTSIKRTGVLFHNEGVHELTVEITPVNQAAETLLLVIIDDPASRTPDGQKNELAGEDPAYAEKKRIRQLQESLEEAGKQILRLHEEYDRASEEIQAAHEELLSSNEELHSINEELETSKEELQSTNEELMTINDELNQRNVDLKEAVEYAEAIVETIRQPLIDLYSDLRIRKANKAFYTFFNLDAYHTEGNYLNEVGSGLFNIPELMDRLRQTISRRLPFQDLEWKFSLPSSGERIVLFSAMRINGQPGKRSRVLLGVEDVTERRLLERKKDEFIGIASHELKTPATSIQAYTQILYNEFVEANDQRSAQLVSKLNNQVTRLANLTRDLLDMTKITQGQLRLKEGYFDIHTLIMEIVEEMQRTTHHRIIFSPTPFVSKFWGDRERIGQVLQNLISNALKFSPAAGQVVVGLDYDNNMVHLKVQDFGIGISPEVQDKIFDRFFRSDDPAAHDHPGLGLGLYISSEIVRQHGGSIMVQSEKGQGSIFIVSLPVRQPAHPVV
jgi:two-component system CheB/CheR fusion protein